MKIGIIGAGMVGESFGKSVIKLGHEVMFSSRTPDSPKMSQLVQSLGGQVHVGTVAQTVAFADLVAVALRWDAIPEAVGEGHWQGKIIIDMSNGFNGTRSAGEEMAMLTKGRVVKALNTIGAEHYQDPDFSGQAATMFIAGDDTDAKKVVRELIGAMGFEVIDAGGLSLSGLLEKLAGLWVQLATRGGQGRNFAFKVIRK